MPSLISYFESDDYLKYFNPTYIDSGIVTLSKELEKAQSIILPIIWSRTTIGTLRVGLTGSHELCDVTTNLRSQKIISLKVENTEKCLFMISVIAIISNVVVVSKTNFSVYGKSVRYEWRTGNVKNNELKKTLIDICKSFFMNGVNLYVG